MSHDRAAARVALWLEEWREVWWTVPIWFGVLVALAVILRRIVREEPLISGSGIPQTELALAGRLSFTWWRVLLAKFLGSWLALFGGLALGREGPSIQMGGAVGAGFHALWRPGGSPCPDRKPLCCGRGRGGPCRRLWGTRRRGAVRLRGNEVPAGYLADCGGVCVGHRRAPHDPHCLRHGAHPSVCGVRSASAVLFLDRGAGRRRLWGARRGIQQDPAVASR